MISGTFNDNVVVKYCFEEIIGRSHCVQLDWARVKFPPLFGNTPDPLFKKL